MKERFGRTGGRLLALLLAAAVTVSLAVPGALGALAGETGPNRILYDGSTVEGIHRMGGMDVEYAVREGAGYYGDALAINPTKMLGSGWAALPLSGAGELDFAAAKGIAMYVKIPAVTQTNFSIRLIDEGWSTWSAPSRPGRHRSAPRCSRFQPRCSSPRRLTGWRNWSG